MSQTITSPTVRFDKGQLQVIPYPEKLKHKYNCKNICATDSRQCYCEKEELWYDEAVAYARAHPIDITKDDFEKISEIMRSYFCRLDIEPQDLTEYKLEGVRMEIKWQLCEICQHEECSGSKQVACLIEDDKPVNEETQSELWVSALMRYDECNNKLSILESEFTIKRN